MYLRGSLCFTFLLLYGLLSAQQAGVTALERSAGFEARPSGEGMQFDPVLPPLQQRAGAPEAYWEHFWIFGDGSFSREAEPLHHYPAGGEYEVIYLATGNYDTGKPPKKKKKKVSGYASADAPLPASNVLASVDRAVGIGVARDAVPEEENIVLITYHNPGSSYAGGKLHLFFNERRFGHPHFTYQESYTYYGEEELPEALSVVWPTTEPGGSSWASLQPRPLGPLSAFPSGLPENRRDEALEAAQEEFLDHRVWAFDGLAPGGQRNVFVALEATPEMLRDTTVTIYMQAAYESADGQLFDLAVLEIPIVSAHDPNIQQVSERKTGFRRIWEKTLKYKTRFQNTGEGPAEQIRIETRFRPEEVLDLERLEVLDCYPEVPLCPDSNVYNISCLDTQYVQNELVFTFRNIYLPGTKQEGVEDKDSTQGFVRYALTPTKKMKRRSFRSRAGIYFDNEPPVYTNWARTRFKWFEPSFMPMMGYKIVPDSSGLNMPFFGVGVASAYKAYGFYLQPELHTGVSGRQESAFTLPPERRSGQENIPGSDLILHRDTVSRTSVQQTVQRYSLELAPLHLRRNLNRFIGLGAGASYLLHFENRDERSTTESEVFVQECFPSAAGELRCPEPPRLDDRQPGPEIVENSRQVIFGDLRFFVDLNIGLARSGPVLGLRNYLRVGRAPAYSLAAYAAWRF